MIRGMPRRHAAIQYAVFEPVSHDLRIASAGMPGPLHLSSDGCHVLEVAGIPPGLFPATSYDTVTVRLQPGDSVLFCTDGITDAFDEDGEQFGIERLLEICCATPVSSSRELLGRIFAQVARFVREREQHDDMAAALFHYRG
jgi:sigma-B regulation protein RsbU (phosphoserine phosphatase)